MISRREFNYSKAQPNRYAERLAEQQIFVVRKTAVGLVRQKEEPPLRWNSTGVLRIGDSRILLELVIHAFEDGATLETIAQYCSTAPLGDIIAPLPTICTTEMTILLYKIIQLRIYGTRMTGWV